MNFTEEEKEVICYALRNYHEAIEDALFDNGLMDKEYHDYFKKRLTIVEYILNTIDPEMEHK